MDSDNIGRNRSWWNEIGKGAFSPGFVTFVDQQIEDGQRPGEWYQRSLGWESVTPSSEDSGQ